jgi:hypothetical protein
MTVARLVGLATAAILTAAPAALAVEAQSAVITDTPATASEASSGVVAFNTSQSRFRPGLDNQGTVFGDAQDPDTGYWNGKLNAAYVVGFEWAASYELRNHFTFDLSSLTPGSATGAVLVLRNGNDWSYGPGGLYRIREVLTGAEALNLRTARPGSVYADLGTGPVYGAKRIVEATATGPVVRIRLNDTGVAAINAAAGGFFSVGGRLTNLDVDPQEGNSFLWLSSSSYGVQRLVVTTSEGA